MMKRIKTYNIFESQVNELSREQVGFLDQCTEGTWDHDPSIGLVEIDGNFDASSEKLQDMHGLKFGKVDGDFICSFNKLTSLEGSPQEVTGGFFCHDNRITSLLGSPQKVGGSFYCYENRLSTLEGSPREVGGDFYCDSNDLISLEGAPQKIGGDFVCEDFRLDKGEWNTQGWLKILEHGTEEAQSLVLTLLSPAVLNQQIKKDPGGTIRKLKAVWNSPDFETIKKQLKFPAELGDVDKTIKSLKKLDDIKDLI